MQNYRINFKNDKNELIYFTIVSAVNICEAGKKVTENQPFCDIYGIEIFKV